MKDSVEKEEGRGGGSELGSDLDPDPWKILWIRIRQNDADQHCRQPSNAEAIFCNPTVIRQFRATLL